MCYFNLLSRFSFLYLKKSFNFLAINKILVTLDLIFLRYINIYPLKI